MLELFLRGKPAFRKTCAVCCNFLIYPSLICCGTIVFHYLRLLSSLASSVSDLASPKPLLSLKGDFDSGSIFRYLTLFTGDISSSSSCGSYCSTFSGVRMFRIFIYYSLLKSGLTLWLVAILMSRLFLYYWRWRTSSDCDTPTILRFRSKLWSALDCNSSTNDGSLFRVIASAENSSLYLFPAWISKLFRLDALISWLDFFERSEDAEFIWLWLFVIVNLVWCLVFRFYVCRRRCMWFRLPLTL